MIDLAPIYTSFSITISPLHEGCPIDICMFAISGVTSPHNCDDVVIQSGLWLACKKKVQSLPMEQYLPMTTLYLSDHDMISMFLS